jgi:hypothetical protein
VSYGEDSCSLLEMLLVLGFTHGSKALVLLKLVDYGFTSDILWA